MSQEESSRSWEVLPRASSNQSEEIILFRDAVERSAGDTNQGSLHENGDENDSSSWQDYWFLDGHHATVKYLDDGGLYFAAGTVTKKDDPILYNAHHAVLWTRQVFTGNVRVTFDLERVDESTP